MKIEYFEAAAVVPFDGQNSKGALETIHKRAWNMFTHDAPYDQGDRPFLFRFEPLGAESLFITMRSHQPFAGATQRALDIEANQNVTINLAMIPTRRIGSREYIPRSTDWPALWAEKAARAGIEVAPDTIVFDSLGRWSWNTGGRTLRVMSGCVSGTVKDPEAFQTAWHAGVGRRKAYGMGMLELATQ